MPKRMRRKLLTNRKKHAIKSSPKYESDDNKDFVDDTEVTTPRGRLKGALKEALDPTAEAESDDASNDLLTPVRRSARVEVKRNRSTSEDSEDRLCGRHRSPQRYVLKLFDRSVDLSQFDEDSPLYPICRAWIANQPRMNYKKFGSKKNYKPPRHKDDSVELPGPFGPPVSKIPKLLPEQEQRNKDNINLNYREAPPPAREVLLAEHCARWAGVKRAWLEQAARAEARYEGTQQLLNRINVNAV